MERLRILLNQMVSEKTADVFLNEIRNRPPVLLVKLVQERESLNSLLNQIGISPGLDRVGVITALEIWSKEYVKKEQGPLAIEKEEKQRSMAIIEKEEEQGPLAIEKEEEQGSMAIIEKEEEKSLGTDEKLVVQKSIREFLREINFPQEKLDNYAALLGDQNFLTVQDLVDYPPEEIDLEKYGISQGKDRKQIIVAIQKIKGPTQQGVTGSYFGPQGVTGLIAPQGSPTYEHLFQNNETKEFDQYIANELSYHKANELLYSSLKQFFLAWKRNQHPDLYQNFPKLRSLPKGCPDPRTNKLYVRQVVLQTFDTIYEKWIEKWSGYSDYGQYIAGPNGIGKSVSLYQISCLARAMGFIVIYVPQCDTWASFSTFEAANHFLLDHFCWGLLDDLDQHISISKNFFKTVRTVLAGGYLAYQTGSTYLLDLAITLLFETLSSITHKPVILCFDEINALFTIKLPYANNYLAYEHSVFMQASQLNLINFNRGFKLLSGTGHQKYILHAPSGTLVNHLLSWKPWENEEFSSLLYHIANENKRFVNWLVKIPRDKILPYFNSYLGNIPRDLRDFIVNFEHFFAQAKIQTNQNPINIILSCLEEWKDMRLVTLQTQLGIYFGNLKEPRKACESLLRSLIQDVREVSYVELDLSLMYIDDQKRIRVISSVAMQALRIAIRSQLLPLSPDLQIVYPFTQRLENDELGRAFERLIISLLLLNGSTTLTTTRIDNSDPQQIVLECNKTVHINKEIPSEKVMEPTLFVQEDKDFPISDMILVSPKTAIILQLTVGAVSGKFPSESNAYSAIYNTKKLNDLIKMQKLRIPSSNKATDTFAESLLSLTSRGSGRVVKDPSNALVEIQNGTPSPLINFYYIIVTSQSFSTRNLYTDKTNEFPWVRVVYRDHLESFLGKLVVDLLPDHK